MVGRGDTGGGGDPIGGNTDGEFADWGGGSPSVNEKARVSAGQTDGDTRGLKRNRSCFGDHEARAPLFCSPRHPFLGDRRADLIGIAVKPHGAKPS